MVRLITPLFLLLLNFSAYADVITAKTTANGNWNDGTQWVGGTAPDRFDTAIVQATAGFQFPTLNVNQDCTIMRLEITGFNSSVAVVSVNDGQMLTVNDSLIITGASGQFFTGVRTQGTSTFITEDYKGTGAGLIELYATSTVEFSGGYSGKIDGTTNSTGAGTTIDFNSSTEAQAITFPSSSTFWNITTNNTHSGGFSLGADINSSNVQGDITVQSGRFRTSTYTMDGNASDQNFIVQSGATFEIESMNDMQDFTDFIDDLQSGCIIEYGGSNQNIVAPNDSETYEDLIISGSGTKSLTQDLIINGDLTINASTLDVTTNNYDITLAGNFNNQATYNGQNTDTVTFNGTAAQLIDNSGTTTFHTLRINNTHATDKVTINSGTVEIAVSGEVDVDDGQLDFNGNLTLLASASGSSRIGPVASGASIEGDINMQRYIQANTWDQSHRGSWVYLGSPLATSIASAWNPEFVTGGFTGSDVPAADNNVLFYYEPSTGSINTGYFAPSNITDSITVVNTPGDSSYIYGWQFYMGASETNTTFDLNGPVDYGSITHSYTYTAADGDETDGWHLITHPYASPIDWDMVDRDAGVEATFYVYDDENAQYVSYTASVGGTHDNSIPAGQSYWIHTNSGGGNITWEEDDKTSEDNLIILKGTGGRYVGDYFSLDLIDGGNSYELETIVRLDENATLDFDDSFDAFELGSNDGSLPYFSTITNNGIYTELNSVPSDFTEDITIPVYLWAASNGNFTLSAKELDFFPSSICITLEDKHEAKSYDLRTDTISFSYSDTTTVARFALHLSAPVSLELNDISCFGMTDGYATALGKGSGPWDYTWKNANDSIIRSVTGALSADSLTNVSEGSYTVEVSNNGTCGDVMEEFQITEPSEVLASISLDKDTVYVSEGGTVNFSNSSSGSDEYIWDFGDTTALGTDVNPSHSYSFPGSYAITMIASNGTCTDTATVNVVVEDVFVGINETIEDATVYASKDRIVINYSGKSLSDATISIYSVTGQLVKDRVSIDNNGKPFSIDASDLNPGVYIVNITKEGKFVSRKVSIN